MNKALAAALIPLLASCVSHGPQSQIGTQARADREIRLKRTSDCVFVSTINDFNALDDRHVVLYSMGQRKAYLAELTGGCFEVKYQMQLATVDGDNNGQICGFGRDSIAYRRMGLNESCPILGLEELSDERRELLGVGKPAPKPKKEKPPAEEKKPGETK
jgi:hypothetical protein